MWPVDIHSTKLLQLRNRRKIIPKTIYIISSACTDGLIRRKIKRCTPCRDLINNDTANEGKQKLTAASFYINKSDDEVKTTPNWKTWNYSFSSRKLIPHLKFLRACSVRILSVRILSLRKLFLPHGAVHSSIIFMRMLHIRKVYERIFTRNQCCGSMTFWCGSGSAYPCLWLMDPDPDSAVLVTDLQDGNKKLI
jgi:hypothetical protein